MSPSPPPPPPPPLYPFLLMRDSSLRDKKGTCGREGIAYILLHPPPPPFPQKNGEGGGLGEEEEEEEEKGIRWEGGRETSFACANIRGEGRGRRKKKMGREDFNERERRRRRRRGENFFGKGNIIRLRGVWKKRRKSSAKRKTEGREQICPSPLKKRPKKLIKRLRRCVWGVKIFVSNFWNAHSTRALPHIWRGTKEAVLLEGGGATHHSAGSKSKVRFPLFLLLLPRSSPQLFRRRKHKQQKQRRPENLSPPSIFSFFSFSFSPPPLSSCFKLLPSARRPASRDPPAPTNGASPRN